MTALPEDIEPQDNLNFAKKSEASTAFSNLVDLLWELESNDEN